MQAVQTVADEQVLQEPEQATQPLLESKYCPALQEMGLRISC